MTIRIRGGASGLRRRLWGGPPGPRPSPPATESPTQVAPESQPPRSTQPAPFAPRRSRPFFLSLCIHGAIVALLALSSSTQSAAPRSLYDQEIRPYEHKLIWYSLKNRTPDVRPTLAKKTSRPPRALRKFDQSLISGVKDDARPPQKVWIPDAPKVDLAKVKVEPLPNLLAVAPAPKRPLRNFQPPPEAPVKAKAAPAMPEAPEA